MSLVRVILLYLGSFFLLWVGTNLAIFQSILGLLQWIWFFLIDIFSRPNPEMSFRAKMSKSSESGVKFVSRVDLLHIGDRREIQLVLLGIWIISLPFLFTGVQNGDSPTFSLDLFLSSSKTLPIGNFKALLVVFSICLFYVISSEESRPFVDCLATSVPFSFHSGCLL